MAKEEVSSFINALAEETKKEKPEDSNKKTSKQKRVRDDLKLQREIKKYEHDSDLEQHFHRLKVFSLYGSAIAFVLAVIYAVIYLIINSKFDTLFEYTKKYAIFGFGVLVKPVFDYLNNKTKE